MKRDPSGWHPADIVAAVKKTGTNLRKLGLANGFADSTLRAALHKPHPRAQRLIAETIGEPVGVLWPDWFDEHGARREPPPRRRPHRPVGTHPLVNRAA